MNSYAASCCTCFRKASSAFATSASWPIADAPHSCRFAFMCSAQHSQPSKSYQPTMTLTIFDAALSAVDRWWSSKGLLLPRSNFALLVPSSSLPHETILYNTKILPASARSLSLCLVFYKTRLFDFSNLLFARVLHLRHSSLIQCRLPCPVAQLRHIFTTPPSFHSISIGPASAATTGGFLLTALSNARRSALPPCTLPRSAPPIKR